MPRTAFGASFLVACLGSTLHAQTARQPASADSVDVLVVDHDFTGEDEFVRVFLQNGQVYRAELNSPDVILQIRGVVRTARVPRIYAFLPSDTPSGTSIAEIYPEADADYEIRSVGRSGSRVATRLRLYRDIRASRRRLQIRSTPGWEVGVELAGGWHSGFVQSSAAAPLGSDPQAGTDVEACFSARGRPGASRLGLCVLGVGYQSQHGARSILWVYTEPRVRILGRVRPGQSNWEMGALLRFGVGISSTAAETPIVLAPGGYIARNIRTNPQGGGWSLQASYSRAVFRGFSRPRGSGEAITPKSHRLTLGIGWYQ